jgi:predicted TIM-barrel fold metal-dependent hydrolase
MIHDAHCHFFSTRFFEALTREKFGADTGGPADAVTTLLGWEPPGAPEDLADRWVAELDANGVSRAALIASIPGDESSVAAAVTRHPDRFVGFFMLDPTAEDAPARTERAFSELGLRCVCLFPAMQRYGLDDPRVTRIFEVAAAHPGAAVFVHCGVLSLGVRKKLGLPSRFDMRCGDPMALHGVATAHPDVPVIIPHFGAGFFRETLIAADLCPNIHVDTSSSNSWMKYHPGLTLPGVFRQALEALGPDRLLFGSDSSFFPRGWHRLVLESQRAALAAAEADPPAVDRILRGNFERLFGA